MFNWIRRMTTDRSERRAKTTRRNDGYRRAPSQLRTPERFALFRTFRCLTDSGLSNKQRLAEVLQASVILSG
jgi:hypothetical protein